MPEPTRLPLSKYLVPISADSPSGISLKYEDEYAEIERARQEEPETASPDIWKRNLKKADWEAVITLGLKALEEKTKDIEIAALVAEALGRRRGLPGLADGLRLVRAIQDTFWDTAHPGADDLELREGVYEFLDGERILPLLIRSVPLTEVFGLPAYSYLKYEESRKVENDLRSKPELEDEFKSEGKIRAGDFDKAAAATDRAFYVRTVEQLADCTEAVKELNESIRMPGRYRQPRTLSKTMSALEEVTKLANQLLARKPAPEPEPSEEAGPESPWPPGDGADVDDQPAEAEPTWEASTPPPWNHPSSPRTRHAQGPSGGPISGPEDARSRIVAAVTYLREADPASPVPYLVVRALSMGELYRHPTPIDPSSLPPPSSEDRQALRRMAGEGSWSELLERAELVLSRPEGTGWLDARRLALSALSELGHEDAARAARALLGAELRDYPDLPRTELDDGTPCANTETRTWIEQTFPGGGDPDGLAYSPYVPPPREEAPEDGDDGGAPSAWDQAQALLHQGRSQEAISLVGRAVREARTGRERFLRTFEQAELCRMMGRPGVALPLLEGLARQIDELRLDRWEDPALCGRVVASLYQCLLGKGDARAREVYQRLCQLDIGQALSLGDGVDA